MKKLLTLALGCTLLYACNPDTPAPAPTPVTPTQPKVEVKVPTFNAQNAYDLIQKQVDFGPRVPKTKEHQACLNWLVQQLKDYGTEVKVQEGIVNSFLDPKMPVKNIIATINPEKTNRVLLCAHWDTRYVADQESDASKQKTAILGADDGGSGVAVLLEIARIIQENPINLGVDIVLFDVEDQGEPEWITPTNKYTSMWCLGSQYWAKNTNGYRAKFGILLDMVGSRGATFPKEGISMRYAGLFVDKIWKEAYALGYNDYFITPRQYRDITDDHLFVNEFAKIPTVDIINLPEGSRTGFGGHWHTQNDNMSIIDKNTLQAVGTTVLNVLYKEAAGEL